TRSIRQPRRGLGLRLVDRGAVRLRRGGLQRLSRRRLALELLPVAGLTQDRADRLTGLGAHRQPVLHPLEVHLDPRGLLLRVVDAQVLDRATITLGARVRDDNAVLRVADLSHPQKPDSYGHVCSLLLALVTAACPRRGAGGAVRNPRGEMGPVLEDRRRTRERAPDTRRHSNP